MREGRWDPPGDFDSTLPTTGVSSIGDTTNERRDGTFDEAKGNVTSAGGDATGDQPTQAEGQADSLRGKIKQGAADRKDKAGDAVDRVKGDDGGRWARSDARGSRVVAFLG